jgi:hypothetical protein
MLKTTNKANQYIERILAYLALFEKRGIAGDPVVIMSADVFETIWSTSETNVGFRGRKNCMICGCKVEITTGTERLYFGFDLLS